MQKGRCRSMSKGGRPRKLPLISQEDAFAAICYFEDAEARDEQEKIFFEYAVVALRSLIVTEKRRERQRKYIENKRKNDEEFIRHAQEYMKNYYEENREHILEKRRRYRIEKKKEGGKDATK